MTGVPPPSMDSPVSPLPASDAEALLHTARTLRAMARAGQTPPLLDRKHLGLLSQQRPSASQGAVENAARGLGARVAWVPPEAVQAADGPAVRDTARLLGQLYDALDCEGLPPGLVQHLREHSGVPVYEGLGRRDHPLAGLLPHLDGGTSEPTGAPSSDGDDAADGHRFLLQAMLVRTLL